MKRHLFFTLLTLLIVSLLLLYPDTLSAQTTPYKIVIFIDEDSLTIYIPGNQSVSIEQLRLETNIAGEPYSWSLDYFQAFAPLPLNNIGTPICLRIESSAATQPLPEECEAIPSGNLVTHKMNLGNIFWYDRSSHRGRTIVIFYGETYVGQCSTDVTPCEIIPPTPTPSFTLTPSPAPTLTFTPSPSLTNTYPATATGTSTNTPFATFTDTATSTPTTPEPDPSPSPSLSATPIPAGVNPNWTPVLQTERGMPLVYVPAGCFIMGNNENYNERPAHEVCLSAFWIGQMEVTNAQYAQCVEDGNCERPSGNVSQYSDPAYADYPVVAVTWQNALNFARWFGGSLPTEAQWEYAARGPMSYVYPWGNARPNDIRANFGVSGLMPADSHHEGASWVGALNMAGNAFEWVFDWYDFQYYAVPEANSTNPTGPQDGLERVIRGGSCSDDEWHIRSAYRGYLTPNSVDPRIGFRVVMPANQ